MNRSGKKCVLYPHVSTEMQVDGFSLDGQKNSLKRFADREEMEIVNPRKFVIPIKSLSPSARCIIISTAV